MSLAIQELFFRYRARSEELFRGLDMTVEAGELLVITGPSGRGKSTLLYLLGLMLAPIAGRILWEGVDMSALDDAQRSRFRARNVGFVFQDAALDATRTVLDNVLEGALYAGMSKADARPKAENLLNTMGVQLRGDHRPGEVSGGQAQRVALCRALVKDPAIVLADEPTGNLDSETSLLVMRTLKQHATLGANSVVVATHDRSHRTIADRVLDLGSS